MATINFKNGLICAYIEPVNMEEEKVDFSLWDLRGGKGGFQTMLTKEDVRTLVDALIEAVGGVAAFRKVGR